MTNLPGGLIVVGGTAEEQLLARWCREAQKSLVSISTLLGPVWSSTSIGDHETDSSLAVLSNLCISLSDSALGLTVGRRLWEADILLRSVFEGTAKFVFLCQPNDHERRRRVEEYKETLPKIAALRDHSHADDVLKHVGDTNADEWRPLRDLLLSPEELAQRRGEFPRSARSTLEQRWSFTELVRELTGSSGEVLKGFALLLHNYGMSSHVAHADWIGASMVWERQTRSADQIQAIEFAHAGRLLVDVITAATLRVMAAYKYKGLASEPVLRAFDATAPLREEVRVSGQRWRDAEYAGARD